MKVLIARVSYWLAAPVVWLAHRSGFCALAPVLPACERLRWRLGRLGVWVRYQSALRRVPAYPRFLEGRTAGSPASVFALDAIPPTDKAKYVNVFSFEARCEDGVLPAGGIVIDESSGSSGVPSNWVRGTRERAVNGRTIRMGLQHRLGTEPLFFINAFALGPWATGINLTLSLSSWARVKSLGPDAAKIENTLRQFGTAHHYVIMGYPPFLKQLADRPAVNWPSYRVSMVFGGEGMSESMRRYIEGKGIARVYGSYGASDLELNIAAETDLTIQLRRLLERHPKLAARILRHTGATPMIFQYNPADFFIESDASGELLVTVCRPDYVAPKVRYNIHDLGHVLRFRDLAKELRREGLSPDTLDPRALNLPLLFHYGRSDASVSYYGCKISPTDVQDSLFRLPALAGGVDAFQLHSFDDDDGDKRLAIRLEVTNGNAPECPEQWGSRLFDTLAEINQDFRESRRMAPANKPPFVELHEVGTGPFAGVDARIKRRYVARGGPGG
jgi:phenylacetate-CoA ligase